MGQPMVAQLHGSMHFTQLLPIGKEDRMCVHMPCRAAASRDSWLVIKICVGKKPEYSSWTTTGKYIETHACRLLELLKNQNLVMSHMLKEATMCVEPGRILRQQPPEMPMDGVQWLRTPLPQASVSHMHHEWGQEEM